MGAWKTAAELAAEQAAYWNGPGGEGLARRLPERIQRAIGDIGDVGLAAAAPQHGEHVIDGGCGTGTTAALARLVGPPCAASHLRAPHHGSARASIGQCHVRRRRCRHASVPGRPLRSRLLASVSCSSPTRSPPSATSGGRQLPVVSSSSPGARRRRIPGTTVRAAQPFLPPQPRPGPEDPGQFAFGDRAQRRAHPRRSGLQSAALRADRPADLDGRHRRRGRRRRRQVRPAGPSRRGTCGHRKGRTGHRRGAGATARIEGVRLPGACCWCEQAPLMEHISTFLLPPGRQGRARSGKSTHAEEASSPGSLFGATPRPRSTSPPPRRATSRWRPASWSIAPAAAAPGPPSRSRLPPLPQTAARMPARAGRLPDALALQPHARRGRPRRGDRRTGHGARRLRRAGRVRQQRGRVGLVPETCWAAPSATPRAASTCAWPSGPTG